MWQDSFETIKVEEITHDLLTKLQSRRRRGLSLDDFSNLKPLIEGHRLLKIADDELPVSRALIRNRARSMLNSFLSTCPDKDTKDALGVVLRDLNNDM
ncbi:MAG: hypothetical protein J4432_04290 [DPANN group archaeon]|nr:hypothetical protein [DPANN group archaeon]